MTVIEDTTLWAYDKTKLATFDLGSTKSAWETYTLNQQIDVIAQVTKVPYFSIILSLGVHLAILLLSLHCLLDKS